VADVVFAAKGLSKTYRSGEIEGAIATIDGWGGTPLLAKVTRVQPPVFTKISALGLRSSVCGLSSNFTASEFRRPTGP
jgi:hypothetical protein